MNHEDYPAEKISEIEALQNLLPRTLENKQNHDVAVGNDATLEVQPVPHLSPRRVTVEQKDKRDEEAMESSTRTHDIWGGVSEIADAREVIKNLPVDEEAMESSTRTHDIWGGVSEI